MADFGDPMMRNPNAAVQARAKAQNRANVLQQKAIAQSHPTGLTPNLLKLFEPRPPLDYKPPPEKRKCPPYTGMAQLVSNFAEPDDPEYSRPVEKGETPAQRRARIHQIRLEEGAKKVAEELKKYDPSNDPNISGDPYKTLFVARLNYETTESRIKREFEAYGPIKQVRLVMDKESNKPRGYAFIEYVHTRDMKAAYKQADGKKIDNRRVLVDVERGRTVPNWRPRRLGGGLGTTRVGVEDTQREQVQSGGISKSEEPRLREERDREKSHERIRDREKSREKSRERSHDRPRDRDHRDDRHHKDRNRNKDREKERDRGRERDRTHDRDRGRDRSRDHDRGQDRDHRRKRDRGISRDYDVADDRDHGHSLDKEYNYDDRVDSKHERKRERNYGSADAEDNLGWHDQPRPETEHGLAHYDYYEHQSRGQGEFDRYRESGRGEDRYDQMDVDGYDRDAPESRDKNYRRSISRE